MTTITLKNNFHNTSVNLRVSGEKLSAPQVKRARRALCGISGCTCGNELGQRGPQEVDIEIIYDNRYQVIGAIITAV